MVVNGNGLKSDSFTLRLYVWNAEKMQSNTISILQNKKEIFIQKNQNFFCMNLRYTFTFAPIQL